MDATSTSAALPAFIVNCTGAGVPVCVGPLYLGLGGFVQAGLLLLLTAHRLATSAQEAAALLRGGVADLVLGVVGQRKDPN